MQVNKQNKWIKIHIPVLSTFYLWLHTYFCGGRGKYNLLLENGNPQGPTNISHKNQGFTGR